MRLKSSIWVAAYLRRCQTVGIFGAVRRRGAEEAGAVFVKVALLDGNAMLYAPAPQTVYDESRPAERLVCAGIAAAGAGAIGGRTPGQGNPLRSGCLDRRDRGPGRACFPGLSEREPLSPAGARAHWRSAAGLHCWTGLRCAGPHAAAFVVVQRGAIFGVVTAIEPRHAASMTSADRRSADRRAATAGRHCARGGAAEFGLRNISTRWNAALGMSSARAAHANGSPPGSLTTCVAICAGAKIRRFADLARSFR